LIKAIHGVKGNIDDSQTKISGSIWKELVREFVVLKSKGNASLNLSFRRLPRSGVEDEQYKNIVSITSDVLVPQMHDRWSWSLNASGDFTIPTRFILSCRGLEIQSILCPLCNVAVETTSHTFFSCSLSRHIMQKYVVGGILISLLSTLMSSGLIGSQMLV
ncbi:RNA-directed DNA polymerase, eukaryota, reverse transcriptase zinc-binding domain protein, partial [Tanacetum coccineum]